MLKPRLSIFKYCLIAFIGILFSLGFFYCNGKAAELLENTVSVGTSYNGVEYYTLRSSNSPVYYGLVKGSWDGYKIICFFSESDFTLENIYVSNTVCYSKQYTNSTYVYYSKQYNTNNYKNFPTLTTYDTYLDLFNSVPTGPLYDDFSLKDFNYTTYDSGIHILNTPFYLDYYITWNGSTNIDYPITKVTYKTYGYLNNSVSNIDTSNGVLLDSGSCTSPFNYTTGLKLNSVNGNFNAKDYDKIVIYITPFSSITEGNSHYIVCNLYGTGITANVFGFDVPTDKLLGFTTQYGADIIQVPATNTVTDGTNYTPVAYVNNVPVICVTQTTSGTYNTYTDQHTENNYYNPVVYTTNDNSIENIYTDNSTVINNNQTYNYVFAPIEIDDESQGYIDSIISFLTSIVTFFSTCWSYFILGVQWLPPWVTVFIQSMTTLLGTIIIGVGILKLLKGVT